MSTKNQKPLPAEAQEYAANNGVAAGLSDGALRNLAGFFDTLVQMDLAPKSNDNSEEEHEATN